MIFPSSLLTLPQQLYELKERMKVLMNQVQQVERTMEEVRASKSKVSSLLSLHTARAGLLTYSVESNTSLAQHGEGRGGDD